MTKMLCYCSTFYFQLGLESQVQCTHARMFLLWKSISINLLLHIVLIKQKDWYQGESGKYTTNVTECIECSNAFEATADRSDSSRSNRLWLQIPEGRLLNITQCRFNRLSKFSFTICIINKTTIHKKEQNWVCLHHILVSTFIISVC